MNILFLDDNLERTKSFKGQVPSAVTVETAQECIDELKKDTKWDYVLLDHDLGGEVFVQTDREDCGMEVVRWIVSNKPSIDHVVVHSLNHVAAKEMKLSLEEVGYEVIPLPFILFNPSQSNIYAILSEETPSEIESSEIPIIGEG